MLQKIKTLGDGAKCYQVQLTLTFRRLKLMQRFEGISLLCIEFQRNTKTMTTSNKLIGDKSMIVWGESLTVTIMLYKDSSGKYLEEEGLLLLKGYAKGKVWAPKTIGTVSLKLNLLAPELIDIEKVALRLADSDGNEVCIIKTAVSAKLLQEFGASASAATTPSNWSQKAPPGWSPSGQGESAGYTASSAASTRSTPEGEARTRNASLSGGLANIYADESSNGDTYLDETSEKFREQFHGRSGSPEVFEFIDDDYLLYDGTSKLYLGPGSPSKMSKSGGLGGGGGGGGSQVAANATFKTEPADADTDSVSVLQRDLDDSRKAVAKLEMEYMRLQSITDVDGDMIDQMVRSEIENLTAAEKETQQLVRELDIAQSQVHTAVLSIEVQELQAELARAKEKITGLQREKERGATPDKGFFSTGSDWRQVKQQKYDFELLQGQLQEAVERGDLLEQQLRQVQTDLAISTERLEAVETQLEAAKKQLAVVTATGPEAAARQAQSSSEGANANARSPLAGSGSSAGARSQHTSGLPQPRPKAATTTAAAATAAASSPRTPPSSSSKPIASRNGFGFSATPSATAKVTNPNATSIENSKTAPTVTSILDMQQRPPDALTDPSNDLYINSQLDVSSTTQEPAAYEATIRALEGVVDSFVRKLQEARDGEALTAARVEDMQAQLSAALAENSDLRRAGGGRAGAESKVGPGASASSSSSSGAGTGAGAVATDRPAAPPSSSSSSDLLVQEVADLRTQLVAVEDRYEAKCAEYDTVIGSFVRKLKESRDAEVAAIARAEELQQQAAAAAGPRRVTPKKADPTAGFVSIWR